MSLARGKYGIEYNPRQMEGDSSGIGWLFLIVFVIAIASFSWQLIGRWRSASAARKEAEQFEQIVQKEMETSAIASDTAKPVEVEAKAVEPKVEVSAMSKRPAKVRNLLMRLDEAEKARDVDLAATTIETLRALPGSPVADLDDLLARRLGRLNIKRLFVQHNAQWIKTIEVKRGDSASRIAFEHGSTLASFAKLNGGNMDRIVVGAKMLVMNHPRFNLVIHLRSRTADLALNGKFFKRYDLKDEPKAKTGAYEIPTDSRRQFWQMLGVVMSGDDQTEIDMLMPNGASVLISEM